MNKIEIIILVLFSLGIFLLVSEYEKIGFYGLLVNFFTIFFYLFLLYSIEKEEISK